MRITFASIIPLVLAGVGRSSSGIYLPLLEVRIYRNKICLNWDFLTRPINVPGPNVFLFIQHGFTLPDNIKTTAELRGKTIHIRLAAMDAPEVSLALPSLFLPPRLCVLCTPTHSTRLNTLRTVIAFW
jgi:hypothetical protein